MSSVASSPVGSRPSTPSIPECATPASILSPHKSNGDHDSNVATPSSPRPASMSRSSTQSSIHVHGPADSSQGLLHQPQAHPVPAQVGGSSSRAAGAATSTAVAAPGTVVAPTPGTVVAAPAKPGSEKMSLPSPPPAAASIPSPSVSPRASMRGRQQRVLAEMPSAADFVGPLPPHSRPKRPGYHSGSPSTHSVASTDTVSSSTGGSSGTMGGGETRLRFEVLPQGGHRHHLSAPRRHQFLASQVKRIRDFLDGRKDDHYGNGNGGGGGRAPHHHPLHLHPESLEHPMTLLNEKYGTPADDHHHHHASPPSTRGTRQQQQQHDVKADFVEKYGELQQIVGKGAFGTVRISLKKHPGQPQGTVYAIKEFKNAHGESQKTYMRRLTSEFCIASSLKHTNVIQTLDLLQLHNDTYSEVMEYCAGGDLHSLIASADTLGELESNCFFAQLINGVAFLHSMGVVHRDIKPENLLLTSDGCIKIADFGNSEVFRMPWEKKVRTSVSIRGSGPFIAPEEFTKKTFDARKVDIWACGIVYMCMRLGRYNWHEASEGDPIWDGFLYKREKILEEHAKRHAGGSLSPTGSPLTTTTPPIPPPSDMHVNLMAIEQATHITLGWPDHIAQVLDHMLEPEPRKRWQAWNVLDSEWIQQVDNCHPSERPVELELDETDLDDSPTHPVGSKVIHDNSAVTGCKVVKDVKQVSHSRLLSQQNHQQRQPQNHHHLQRLLPHHRQHSTGRAVPEPAA